MQRVTLALEGIDWELVFVDDNSTDGTWQRLYDQIIRPLEAPR